MPDLADTPEIVSISTTVERTRDARHGDFTTNIAMRLAKSVGKNPREIAQTIIDNLPDSDKFTFTTLKPRFNGAFFMLPRCSLNVTTQPSMAAVLKTRGKFLQRFACRSRAGRPPFVTSPFGR